MKLRPTKRRLTSPVKTKAKRTDLNNTQRALLRQIKNLDSSIVQEMVSRTLETLTGPRYLTMSEFYTQEEAQKLLGWSPATVERYLYLYHRIVRRDNETAGQFRARKLQFRSLDAPVVGGEHLISPRVMVFLVLAPTTLKGGDKEQLRLLRTKLLTTTSLGRAKAKRIGKNAAIISWVAGDDALETAR